MEAIKKSPRKNKIINLILKNTSNLTLEELSEKLNVSKRTMYRELREINEILNYHEIEIKNKKNQGITVLGSSSAIEELSNLIKEADKAKYSDSDIRRRKLILDSLKNREVEKLSYYSNVFKVSESTISNDLNYVEEWLGKYRLGLTREPGIGIRVVGMEADIRVALKALLSGKGIQEDKYLFKLSEDIKEPLEIQIFKQLNINPKYIFKTLKEYESSLGGIFVDESFNALAIHIAISIRRIMDGNNVPHTVTSNVNEYEEEYILAKKLSEKIESYYDVIFSESEVYFLFLHIISTKMLKDSSIIFKLQELNEEDIVKKMAEEIIRLVNNTKQITIDKDKYLDNLIIHLRPTINRIEHGLKLENPLLNTIKKEYSESYGIAWMTNSIFKRYIGKDISEDEAAFIAIHIESMIEGTKEYLKVVIVCSSGIGISQLIATRIEQRYTQLNIVGIESVASFYDKNYGEEVDLVLSTFPIETNLSTIVVDPLLSEADIRKIDAFIYSHSIDIGNVFNNIVLETFIHPKWFSQNEVIENVSRELFRKELVYEKFYNSIYEREEIHSTSIGMKVALPHAEFNSVKKSSFAVVTLEKPILWGEDYVDLIVFIALTKKDSTWAANVLKDIYYKLYVDSSHKLLIESKSYQDILKILIE